MANIKISELDELQKATDQDLLVIVDVANNNTKKIQAGNLGILVPKTTKTTSDTETYSCNYVNGIVESGSNENGNWIKYNDGTMICTATILRNISNTNSWNGFYIGEVSNIPFPKTFIQLYSCNIDIYSLGNVWKMSGSIPTLSGTNTFFTISPESFQKDMYFYVTAIGKWK